MFYELTLVSFMLGVSTVGYNKNARGNGFGVTISYERVVANTSPLCLVRALCAAYENVVVVLWPVRARCIAVLCRIRAVFGGLLLELNRALCVESSWNPLSVFAEELYLSLYYRS